LEVEGEESGVPGLVVVPAVRETSEGLDVVEGAWRLYHPKSANALPLLFRNRDVVIRFVDEVLWRKPRFMNGPGRTPRLGSGTGPWTSRGGSSCSALRLAFRPARWRRGSDEAGCRGPGAGCAARALGPRGQRASRLDRYD
jgi:hypothetical protein